NPSRDRTGWPSARSPPALPAPLPPLAPGLAAPAGPGRRRGPRHGHRRRRRRPRRRAPPAAADRSDRPRRRRRGAPTSAGARRDSGFVRSPRRLSAARHGLHARWLRTAPRPTTTASGLRRRARSGWVPIIVDFQPSRSGDGRSSVAGLDPLGTKFSEEYADAVFARG